MHEKCWYVVVVLDVEDDVDILVTDIKRSVDTLSQVFIYFPLDHT